MNYGIGVRTPRGTGTSGWVQQSKAYVKQSVIDQHKQSTRNKTKVYDEEARKPKARRVSSKVLEHERQNKIEDEVVEWCVAQGFYRPDCAVPPDEREKLISEKRKEVAERYREVGDVPEEELHDGTHAMAKEKEEENDMMKRVLRVSDNYADGNAFSKEYQQQRRLEKMSKRYEEEREKRLKDIEREEKERLAREEALKAARKEKREAERRQRKVDKQRRKQRKQLKKLGLSPTDIETVLASADPDAAFDAIMKTVADVKKEKASGNGAKDANCHSRHHHHHHHHSDSGNDSNSDGGEKSKHKGSKDAGESGFDASLVKKEEESDAKMVKVKVKDEPRDGDESKGSEHHRNYRRRYDSSSATSSGSESGSDKSGSSGSEDEKARGKHSHKRRRSRSSSSDSDSAHESKRKRKKH